MPMPMTCECRELRERMNSFRSSNWKNGVWFMDKCRMFITHAQNPRLNQKKRQLASISYIECRHPYVFLCRWRNNRSWVTTNLWIVFTRFTHKTNPRHFASQTRIVSHFSRYTTCNYHHFSCIRQSHNPQHHIQNSMILDEILHLMKWIGEWSALVWMCCMCGCEMNTYDRQRDEENQPQNESGN